MRTVARDVFDETDAGSSLALLFRNGCVASESDSPSSDKDDESDRCTVVFGRVFLGVFEGTGSEEEEEVVRVLGRG